MRYFRRRAGDGRRDRGRRHPHRLHGRPRLRALGRRRQRARALGRPDRGRRRPRPAPVRDPGDGRRPGRGRARPDRGRLHERPHGADAPSTSTRRSRSASAGSSTSTRRTSSAGARSPPSARPVSPARRLVGIELDWGGIEAAFAAPRPRPGRPGDRQPRADPGLLRRRPGRPATSTCWSPTLKKMIALASLRTRAAARRAARDRVVGRGRARPRRGQGRRPAVPRPGTQAHAVDFRACPPPAS